MSFLVLGTTGAADPSISGDSMTDPFKAGQLSGVDVDHVARPYPMVAAHRLVGLHVLESAETQGFEHSIHQWSSTG